MFGTVRKHQQWLWIFIIAVMSISLVVFFTDDVGRGGQRAGELGSINGRQIGPEEYLDALREVRMSYFFRSGGREWPGNDAATQRNMERDTLSRLFILEKVKELDLHVSDKAVLRLIHERLGTFPYANFIKEYLEPQQITSEQFARFMRHEALVQQLISVASLNARLLNPREAEFIYRKEHEEVAADVALFWTSNYLDQVTITNGVLGRYYTNQMARYRVPERTVASYVEFMGSNYLAEADKEMSQVTNLQARLDEAYLKLGTNYFKDTNGVVLGETEAKQKFKEEQRLGLALRAAHKAAAEFATELYDQPQRHQAANLERLAAAKGYLVTNTPPFDRVGGLDGADFPDRFRQVALSLSTNDPISFTPVRGAQAVYVLALKEKVPSELPSLEKILDKVTADYKQSQALELARRAGAAFHPVLTNALAQNKGFTEVCAEQKVKSISLPPISPSTRQLEGVDERINLRFVQSVLGNLEPGQASAFFPMPPEGGLIVFLRQRLPFDEGKVQKELPDYLNTLRSYRQSDAFNQWFRKQAEKDDGLNRWYRSLTEQDQKTAMQSAPAAN